MGPHCLPKRLLKHFSRRVKQTTIVAIGALRAKAVIPSLGLIFQNPDTDSDSEAEEENLEELETMLKEHDPEYQKYVRYINLNPLYTSEGYSRKKHTGVGGGRRHFFFTQLPIEFNYLRHQPSM